MSDGIVLLDPKRVKPFADQPRKRFHGIRQLAESIRRVGQVTPVVVTRCTEEGYDAELVDGERRLQACLSIGKQIRAIFDESTQDRYIRSVAANFCRKGHDAEEIMQAVTYMQRKGHTCKEIAEAFGKTATWVVQYASLAKLAPEILEQLKSRGELTKSQSRKRGQLTLSVALLLVPLPHDMQRTMLKKIQVGDMSMAQARTFVVRQASSKQIKVGRDVSPAHKFKAVASAVENCSHVIERYLKMPGVEIKALILNAPVDEKKRLAERLEGLCESLLALSDALESK